MKLIKIFVFIIIISVSLLFLLNQLVQYRNKTISIASPVIVPIPDALVEYPPAVKNNLPKMNDLQGVVNEALKGTRGVYGIVIKNIKTGEQYAVNEHDVFDSASLYKLWVLAAVYKKIQAGQLQANQLLRQDVATLNTKFSIASESAEQTDGVISFTVHEALVEMTTISDNYAALLLTEKIGLSSVAAFLKEYAFIESTVGTTGGFPTATASDIALFFEKLYAGELANRKYTDEMIRLLKNQQLNGGLPKYLPDTVQIAHKTGEIDVYKHDAGIVYGDKGDYIVIVLSESDDPQLAQERIALVSKGVFEYFSGK